MSDESDRVAPWIVELRDSRLRSDNLAPNGQREVRSQYTWKATVSRILTIYVHLTGS
jgi:hypothetical protein